MKSDRGIKKIFDFKTLRSLKMRHSNVSLFLNIHSLFMMETAIFSQSHCICIYQNCWCQRYPLLYQGLRIYWEKAQDIVLVKCNCFLVDYLAFSEVFSSPYSYYMLSHHECEATGPFFFISLLSRYQKTLLMI